MVELCQKSIVFLAPSSTLHCELFVIFGTHSIWWSPLWNLNLQDFKVRFFLKSAHSSYLQCAQSKYVWHKKKYASKMKTYLRPIAFREMLEILLWRTSLGSVPGYIHDCVCVCMCAFVCACVCVWLAYF